MVTSIFIIGMMAVSWLSLLISGMAVSESGVSDGWPLLVVEYSALLAVTAALIRFLGQKTNRVAFVVANGIFWFSAIIVVSLCISAIEAAFREPAYLVVLFGNVGYFAGVAVLVRRYNPFRVGECESKQA